MKKIGIITSGGDCGGLNAVVKGAAQMALHMGLKCFIIPSGYAGLYNLIDFDKIVELTEDRVDFVNSNLAGSEAGHSRVKIKKIDDENKYERIKAGLKKFEIDGLVISGGDDTGNVMVDLNQHGIKCIHAPKTMDLDLQTYSVGGDSTINRITNFAEEIKTTGRSHNRIIVMEVFGRYAGHTAFRAGVASEADAIIIPEVPVDFDVLYKHCRDRFIQRVSQSDVKGGTYLIIVAEGLRNADGSELVDEAAGIDAFGHKRLAGAAKYVTDNLAKKFKSDPEVKEFMKREHLFVPGLYECPEVRSVTPGHLVRSGHTSAYDVNFGKQVGAASVVLLNKGLSGVTVVDVDGKNIQYMDTPEAIKQRHVDMNIISFYENLGICFGREPKDSVSSLKLQKVSGPIARHL